MKHLIYALLLIFAIQIAMVATLYWPEADLLDIIRTEKMVPFDATAVDEVHVGDDKGNEAVLVKAGDHWVLPDLTGLKISPSLIDGLLEGVIQAQTRWPVASSNAARQRFALTDYNFKRRLTLIGNGDLLGTIYLGKSPGFRKVYARNSVQDQIFSISYNSIDASGNDGDWLDKRTLQIPLPTAIFSDNYALQKSGDTWLSSKGLPPDERELGALLKALDTVQIEGIANKSMQHTLSIAVPEIELTVNTKDRVTRFELFTVGQRHYIHCSDHSMFFTMSSYDFNRFEGLDAKRLSGTE